MFKRLLAFFQNHPPGIFTLIAVVLAAVAVDAFFIEPNWIEVSTYSMPAPVERPITIAQISDLHTQGFGKREQRLVNLLEASHPDLIAITGDAVTPKADYVAVASVLKHFHAPLGVWMVRGNWENWRPIENDEALYRRSGVMLLNNTARAITKQVWLLGLDDALSGIPSLDKAQSEIPDKAFVIALFHSPDYFQDVKNLCDLALSGHSHGGQCRLPFIGPLWVPPGCGPYLAGWYQLGRSRMYVSRGIGTSVVNARFLCRPELVLITLKPQRG